MARKDLTQRARKRDGVHGGAGDPIVDWCFWVEGGSEEHSQDWSVPRKGGPVGTCQQPAGEDWRSGVAETGSGAPKEGTGRAVAGTIGVAHKRAGTNV